MRIFVDMDNTLVDFRSALRKRGLPEDLDDADELEGLFAEMDPLPDALEAYRELVDRGHDVYILSTAPWGNASAWSDKVEWVKAHLGDVAHKRLILSHHKHLLRGDVLIDDRRKRGAGAFSGRHIHFGQPPFLTWRSVLDELDDIT
jgi:5'-nucleotidase